MSGCSTYNFYFHYLVSVSRYILTPVYVLSTVEVTRFYTDSSLNVSLGWCKLTSLLRSSRSTDTPLLFLVIPFEWKRLSKLGQSKWNEKDRKECMLQLRYGLYASDQSAVRDRNFHRILPKGAPDLLKKQQTRVGSFPKPLIHGARVRCFFVYAATEQTFHVRFFPLPPRIIDVSIIQ